MLIAILVSAFGMPWAVFTVLGAGADVTTGALIAGIFSVLNTYLNFRMLRQVGVVNKQVGATRASAHEGVDALIRLAEEKEKEAGENKWDF